MKLNKQQQAINEVKGKNVIVSASAGTGKTTVLTDRIISYLKQGNDINDYLVVSFTSAAADELKDRIAKAIRKAMDAAPADLQKHYQNQLARIPLADISTIHSFCLDLLISYGYVLGLDPAKTGKLADEGKIKKLKDKAFRLALKETDYNSLIYRFCDRPEDIDSFYRNIADLDRFLENLEQPEKWKEKVLNSYELMADNDYHLYPLDLKEFFAQKLKDIERCSSSLMQLYNANLSQGKTLQKAQELDGRIREALEECQSYLSENDFEKIAGKMIELSGKYPAIGNSKFDKTDKEEAKKLKEEYDELIPSLQLYYIFNEANRRNREVIEQLFRLTDSYHKHYVSLKEKEELISFEDMLVKAAEILKANNGYVADIYRNKYKEILVDEYQDTNQNQENIIKAIAKKDNVFRVGDVKQSIYKFQNAKPELMKNFIDHPGNNDEVLPLQNNYRSSVNIISFSNFVFEKLMNMIPGSYKPADDLLIPEEKKDQKGEKIRLVSVPYESDEKIVSKDKKGQTIEKPARVFNSKEKADFIGSYIASEIIRLKSEHEDLKWSSFVILLRSNRYKALLKRVLNRHNVPVYTIGKTGFFSDPAVSTVISLLSLILKDSRLDSANVLSGPLFDYSYEQIASAKEVLEQENEKNNSELKKLVEELRGYHKDHSLSQVLDKIYNYNDYYLSKTDSFERSNLDSLYQMVLDFEKDNGCLSDLLIYLKNYSYVDRQEASGYTSRDDVVQIMTIHQSKGLQFEYVFLADLYFKSGGNKYNSQSVFNEKDGISPRYVSLPHKIRHENPYYDLISHDNEYDDFAEELRILYVAVTRSISGFYVVNVRKYDPDKYELTYESLYDKSQMDWIRTALEDAPPETMDIVEIETLSEKELQEHEACAEAQEKKQVQMKKYSEKANLIKQLEVISPSSLEERDISHLDFEAGSGSERGTLMHKTIELLGIRKIERKDVEALPYKLSDEDVDKIVSFYDDPFTISLYDNQNEHEYPFIAYEDDKLINGVIDLLSIGNEILVIDFKSDKHTSEEKLISRYAIQLNNYRQIVKKKYPDKMIRALIYSFELRKYVEVKEES